MILFHDDNADTEIALAELLGSWRRQGLGFRTLSDAGVPAAGQSTHSRS